MGGWQARQPDGDVRKRFSSDSSLRFGVFWPYSRTPIPSAMVAARNPDILDLEAHVALARAMESAGLDFLLIPDGYAAGSDEASAVGFQDPSTHAVIWAAPLMLATRRIGVMSTMHTTFLHPVHLARFGGQLDALSGGRWGWNIVAGNRPNEARLFGYDGLPDHDLRYDMADECVRAVDALWAVNGAISHHGAHYNIEGRMRGPRPAVRPAMVSAASSARGRTFAAAHCDYLFASITKPADLLEIRADLAAKAKEMGRAPPPTLLFATILVRKGEGEAAHEWDDIQRSLDPAAQKVWSGQLAKATHGGKLTTDYPVLLGTPAEVATQILALREETGLSGFVLRMPYWAPGEADMLGEVLAELGRVGAWRSPAAREFSW
jgi:alkanesulfonate monooxygenase SsuD/methylene tetrahydromethanopterin reductase-like flavin-dependent oxidoreductase (luciferase family)